MCKRFIWKGKAIRKESLVVTVYILPLANQNSTKLKHSERGQWQLDNLLTNKRVGSTNYHVTPIPGSRQTLSEYHRPEMNSDDVLLKINRTIKQWTQWSGTALTHHCLVSLSHGKSSKYITGRSRYPSCQLGHLCVAEQTGSTCRFQTNKTILLILRHYR